jgi:hypothetical protein
MTEELTLRLTDIFAEKCLTAHERSCFKETFKSLAVDDSGLTYWSESCLAKFLELPKALDSGAVVYQLCRNLGAFPFPSRAPATLTGEALLRIVCLMTGRHMRVLRKGKETWTREMWRSCAVSDEETFATTKGTDHETAPVVEDEDTVAGASTAKVGSEDNSKRDSKLLGDDDDDDDNEKELAFYALELIDALEIFEQAKKVDVHHATIPYDNFRKLLELLLLIAPLESEQTISLYTTDLDQRRVEGLRAVADCILRSFGVEQSSGIGYNAFDAVVSNTLPHLFEKFAPLFENFLSTTALHRSIQKEADPEGSPEPTDPNAPPGATLTKAGLQVESKHMRARNPILPIVGDILDQNLLSQLSFIFSGINLFHHLSPLYLGTEHGYSMGSFEKSVFSWPGHSILLVSGTLISQITRQSHARTFLEDLPHRRLSSSLTSPLTRSPAPTTPPDTQRIVYGAYVAVPWKATDKTTFGDEQTTLFQLSPHHDVFPASSNSQNYIYFNKPPSTYPGLGFGSPLPSYTSLTTSQQSISRPTRRESVTTYSASDVAYNSGSFSGSSFSGPSSPGLTRRSSLLSDESIPLGPVSLHIDDALQFAAFTHLASGGGSFEPSKLPAAARAVEWQDRFEIDAIEVWGVTDWKI